MTRAILAFALLASPVAAQERHEWAPTYSHGLPSWVELGPPAADGAIATVTFENQPVHEGSDEFTLTHGGMTVRFVMMWNVDAVAELLRITPPDGFFAWPETLTVHEHETGVAHIYPLGVAS